MAYCSWVILPVLVLEFPAQSAPSSRLGPALRVSWRCSHTPPFNQGLSSVPLQSDARKKGQQRAKSLIARHRLASSGKDLLFFSGLRNKHFFEKWKLAVERGSEKEKRIFTYDVTYMWDLTWHNWAYLQNRNRLTDTGWWLPEGRGVREGWTGGLGFTDTDY